MRDVHVNIDETGSDVQAGDIDDPCGGGCRNVLLDGGDFAGRDSDVHDAVNVVCWVDHVAAFENEIVCWGLRVSSWKK